MNYNDVLLGMTVTLNPDPPMAIAWPSHLADPSTHWTVVDTADSNLALAGAEENVRIRSGVYLMTVSSFDIDAVTETLHLPLQVGDAAYVTLHGVGHCIVRSIIALPCGYAYNVEEVGLTPHTGGRRGTYMQGAIDLRNINQGRTIPETAPDRPWVADMYQQISDALREQLKQAPAPDKPADFEINFKPGPRRLRIRR